MRITILLICLIGLCGCKKEVPAPKTLPQFVNPQPIVPPIKIGGTYNGTWVTTNRGKLDGTMTCVVTNLDDNRWKGTFSGVWLARKYSYDVDWTGPSNELKGSAVIDGANYQWTGIITETAFKGTFTGNRYNGSFDLKK
jgi:hypothetical protein